MFLYLYHSKQVINKKKSVNWTDQVGSYGGSET